MGPRYSAVAYWGPRPQSPEACVAPFLRMLEALSAIDPVFGNWTFLGPTKGTPLAPLGKDDIARLIAEGVSREDDGTPFPQAGYQFGASNGRKRTGRGVKVRIHAGTSFAANYLINLAHLMTEPLDEANASLINLKILRPAMLALASAWDTTWCQVSPWGIEALETQPRPRRPLLGLAWMTYISPRFAPMVTPPRSAIVERLPDGALLMIATEDRFDATNPAHLAVARDIEAALAPINALPWPPDA
ncbi:MAG TPA: Imm52 family immunity protein [Stellaceae bacterium]